MMLSDDHCCDDVNNVVIATISTSDNQTTCHEQNNGRRRRSDSLVVSDDSMTGALDALATLACSGGEIQALDDEMKVNSSSSTHITPQSSDECCGDEEDYDEDDDSETMMPPPPPRVSAIAARSLSSSVTNDYLVGSGSILPTPPSPSKSSYTFSFLHDSYYPASNLMKSSVTATRIRSASNPEGMEKWDLYSHRNDRQHFVLPSSILEEELASTRRVLAEVEEVGGGGSWMGAMFSSQRNTKPGIVVGGVGVRRSAREKRANTMRLGTSSDSMFMDEMGEDNSDNNRVEGSVIYAAGKSQSSGSSKSTKKTATGSRGPSPKTITKSTPPVEVIGEDEDEEEEEGDESLFEPEELLRRARSRLLEDLSEGGEHHGNGHRDGRIGGGSVLILPHALSKYKEVYNKNGRIGIYTPAERAAIIHKFNAKRVRRVWNKKIRYNCRKNLADRRMRVKGRFVKRSMSGDSPPTEMKGTTEEGDETLPGEEEGVIITESRPRLESSRTSSPPTTGSPLCTVNELEEEDDEHDHQPMDEDMPDVGDDEAGFESSEDMPYRRTRRYTIT